MRLLQIDWKRFLALLPQWEALPPKLRLDWLQMQPSELYTVVRRREARPLLDGGWLAPAGGDHYELARRRRHFHRVLRTLGRVPVLDLYGEGNRQILVDYLGEHYTLRDCAALGRSGAVTDRAEIAAEMDREQWVGDFLQVQGPGGAPAGAAQRWRRAPAATVAAARKLIETVLEHEAPIALVELLAAPEGGDASWLRSGLAFGCKEALLLVCLDGDSRPFVGVWRAPSSASAGKTPAPAAQFDGRPLFCRPLLIDDMVTLLIEATAAPPRIKADKHALFARAHDSIGGALAALPGWIRDDEGPLARNVRVNSAVYYARQLGLAAAAGERGKNLSLVVTERGRRWLTCTAADRLKQVVDAVRDGADGGEDDAETWETGLDFLPYDPSLEYAWVPGVDCRRAIVDAFRSIANADAVGLDHFLRRDCRRYNPLHALSVLPYVVDDDLDQHWNSALLAFFNRRLIALGAVALGPLTDGQLGFRLTSVGRYLLGETEQFELDAPDETGDVLVQPNFEIVFLAPSLDAQLRARGIAEPTTALQGPESVGTLFVLSRESVQRAVSAGQEAAQVVTSLRELSKHPLPDNVERQVTAWAAEVRWIEVRPAVVVECGDAETAARVLAAAGKAGRGLSATTVELLAGTRLTAAQRKKLMAAGIFVRS